MLRMFTEEQVVQILQEREAGVPLVEICRRYGLSGANYRLKGNLEQLVNIHQPGLRDPSSITTEQIQLDASCATFVSRLRTLRLSSNLSFEGLASKIGVSKVTVWKWEQGKCVPRRHHVLALSDTFAVSPGWLAYNESGPFGGSDEEPARSEG